MDRGTVRELARQVVQRAAPEQAEEFDSRADAWFRDPARARSGGSGRGTPLGFGLETVVATIVPLALYVTDHVVSAVTEVSLEGVVKQAWPKIRGSRKHKQEQSDERDERAPGTEGQAADHALNREKVIAAYHGDREALRKAAVDAGNTFGASPEQVRLVADQLVIIIFPEHGGRA